MSYHPALLLSQHKMRERDLHAYADEYQLLAAVRRRRRRKARPPEPGDDRAA